MSSTAFRPDIQGLRAVAVLLVVLNHAGVPGLSGGYVGVDVFFVVSGFVISRGLLAQLRQRGRIDLPRFYADRARRILPASLAVILLTTAAAFVLVSPLRLRDIVTDAVASVLYIPNIRFALLKTDYLAGTAPSPFQHFWSLGIEEQFYLLWPVLLLGIFLLTRRRMPRLTIIVAALAIASFAACLLLTATAQPLAFFSLPARAWELAAGALVALLPLRQYRMTPALGWLGLAAILASAVLLGPDTVYPGWPALVPVAGAMLVIAFGAQSGHGSVGRVLGIRPLVFVGAISYSLYLVHWPLLVLAHERLGLDRPLPLALAVILGAAAVPLAYLLFRFVETPFRRRRVAPPRRALIASGVATVTVLGVLLGAGPAVAMIPLATDRAVASTVVAPNPRATDFVPSNVSPSLADATADTGELYTDGCQQGMAKDDVLSCSFGDPDATIVIALFGDSHAGRWFPALKQAADALGARVETFTKSRCRSVDTAAAWAATENAGCTRWRTDVLARLRAHPPTVVVLANHLGPTVGRSYDVEERDWEHGFTTSIEQLPASSKVVTLADSPEFASSPVLCLAGNLDNADRCAVSPADGVNHAIAAADVAVAKRLGTGHIDLTEYFCGPTSCPPIIGRTLVYSDEHHMTATFSGLLARPLTAALRPYLGGSSPSP
ncbi:acyltransferase family protein [Lacisediminihabitans changchengi]|uniref:Acyltransferase n=1 Tax=Lacisediminihabitans changchengi TaxID=2787634 RepID=A0A934SNH8_9MICO|nr:acyltransferase family protein [Lacisediminihabitans changchengi]MBK4348655.1 acyltransferase [Lacisediminihabitans changchengi]